MPLRFTLRQLEYFVAVGELEHCEAAEQVQRFPRPRQCAPGNVKLLSDADALHDVAGDISDKVRGPLAIGCLLTFAQIVLPSLRQKFEREHPEVRIRQFERNQGQLLEMLQRGDIDLALTYDLELSQDIAFEPLISLPAYVMLPEGHRLTGRESVTPEELADEPMVLLDLPYSREYFLSAFHQKGISAQYRGADGRHSRHAFDGWQWLWLRYRQYATVEHAVA